MDLAPRPERPASPEIAEPHVDVADPRVAALRPRPWLRYLARTVDLFLYGTFLNILAGMTMPALSAAGVIVVEALTIVSWIPLEALLLSTAGTTPGKWLFSIQLRNARGDRPRFGEAAWRSFSVWWRGLACGIPVASLVTVFLSYSHLISRGVTKWDERRGFLVLHGRVSPWRMALLVLLFVGYVAFLAVGSAADAADPLNVPIVST